MKPKELLNYCGEHNYCQNETERNISFYLNEDCVIAYDKNKLGVIFIIKGKKKYFGYVCIKSNLYLGDGYTFRKTPLKDVVELLGEDCEVLDKEEYFKMKRKVILMELEE